MSDENVLDDMKEKMKAVDEALTKPDGTRRELKGFAKYFTLVCLGIILVMGILGNFAFMGFNMATYNAFVPVFAIVLAPFVVSIGADGVVKRYNEGKKKVE